MLRPATESSLQKIIRLIKEAQQQKAPAQQFTDKFGSYYTYAVIGLSFVMFFVWWLGFHLAPFASKSAGPQRFLSRHDLARRRFALRSGPFDSFGGPRSDRLGRPSWHSLPRRRCRRKIGRMTTVALDKTGTLTTGELRVETVESFPPGNEKEIAVLAYSLERLSTHPLARAITRYGKQQQLDSLECQNFESITGQGLRARRNGSNCLLGRRDWVLRETALAHPPGASSTEPGHSEIWLSSDGLFGRIILRDDIRPQSRQLIDELRSENLHPVVLTGDRKAAAEHLRTQLNLDDVRAELTPEQKLAEIRLLTSQGKHVAMVGDGVNDAPSLAAAHIGVAMGARGSDAALEQADVVLMHDRLENFLAAFRLSQRARRIIRQNLVISLGTVVVLVTFALLGKSH